MSVNLPYIQTLMDDPTIQDILIDGWQRVYVEKNGVLEDIPTPFQSEEELYGLIYTIAGEHGKQVFEKTSIASFRLADNSHAEVIVPPVSLTGPAITILKSPTQNIQLEDLLKYGSLTQAAADFLRACVEARINIIVSGGASSGKTTFLMIMAGWIPQSERILLLQNFANRILTQPRLISLETCPPDLEGKGEVTMVDLVRSALRMRPDRIIVQELVGSETYDLLGAMNHGHDGSMASLHANNPRDVLSRLEMMAGKGNPELPLRALREQISSAIDLVVHYEYMKDGSRKITNITEVTGIEDTVITMADIFVFDLTGYEEGKVMGSLRATGFIPRFLEKLDRVGIHLPVSMFAFEEV